MKIVVDENVAYADDAFSTLGEVIKVDGRNLTAGDLKGADALIVRSVTKVNEELLKGTTVKFVATATIGDEHLDKEYLEANNIVYASSPGCNAQAVEQYVITAISNYLCKTEKDITDLTIGIIGVGNIGSLIAESAEQLGMRVILNDPPKQAETESGEYSSIEEALKADIVTLHVPLTKAGEYKTEHLIGEKELALLKPGAMFINASRGAVVDNNALLEYIKTHEVYTVLDVWENEPNILPELLEAVDIATPHVAGYSLEGKANGTKMTYDALCRFCGTAPIWDPVLPRPDKYEIDVSLSSSMEEGMYEIFNSMYPINEDSEKLKSGLANPEGIADLFDRMRKEYPYRRELDAYEIIGKEVLLTAMNIK